MAETQRLSLGLGIADELTFAGFIDLYNENLEKIDFLAYPSISNIVVNGNFPLAGNEITECHAIQFVETNIEPTSNATVFFLNGEFHIRDGSGRVIQVSDSGSVNVSSGQVRGEKIAESGNLRTSGNVVGGTITTIFSGFTVPRDKDEIYVISGDNLDIKRGQDNSFFGFVVDLIVGTETTDTVVIPMGGRANSGIVSGSLTSHYILKASNNQFVRFNYVKNPTSMDYISFSYGSVTLPENTKVRVYEAEVAGKPGLQGPAGERGPAGEGFNFSSAPADTK